MAAAAAAAEDVDGGGGGDCGKRYLAVASVIGDWSASSGGKDSLCPMAYDQTHPREKTEVAAMWDLFVADQIDFCC